MKIGVASVGKDESSEVTDGPTVRNQNAGHSMERPVEELYIRISDEELLKAVDSMTFNHGRTELDMIGEL